MAFYIALLAAGSVIAFAIIYVRDERNTSKDDPVRDDHEDRGAHPGGYFLGWATTQVLGRRLLAWFESLLDRLPWVKTIYGGIKIFLAAFQTKPERVERVVLIDFPSPEMKTIGLETRTMIDEASGEELAVVYVPTSPNPTSGFIQIMSLTKVISTKRCNSF